MMDGLTEDPIVRIHCTKLCTSVRLDKKTVFSTIPRSNWCDRLDD